jgi:PAS domain S-box-containing protein
MIVFFFFSTGVGFVGYFYFQNEKKDIVRQKEGELSAIADLKVKQIADWRKECTADALVLAKHPLIIHYIEEYLRNPGSSEVRNSLLEWMALRQKNCDYVRFSLIDMKGRVRLSVPEGEEVLGPDAKGFLSQSISTNKIIFSNIYKSKILDQIRLSLFVPVSKKEMRPIGVFLIRIDVHSYLFPLIQWWPTPSKTSETILFYKEGDEVVFLNELRHKKGMALTVRYPVSEIELPEAMAVRGQTGITQGVDYRGKRVLAVLRRIPDSPWFLLAKVDTEEINAPILERARIVGIVVGNWILAFAIVLAFFWRQRIAQIRWKHLQVEFERQTLEKRFDYLSKFANDIIVLADEMKIVEVNDRAVEAYGYTRDELFQLHVWDLGTPETRPLFKELLKKQADGKGLILQTTHQRKDGRSFPVEISSRLIEVGGKKFYQGIIRDITERHELERALNISKAMLESVFDGISEPLILVDKDLSPKMFNKAAREYFQPMGEMALRKPCLEMDRSRNHACRTCKIPEAVSRCEYAAFERNGFSNPERVETVFVYPVEERGSKTGDAIIRIRDITEEVKLKEEMAQADKLISLGTLVAGVAHEINNPTNYIMLNAPILSDVWQGILSILDEYHQTNGEFSVAGLPYSEIKNEIPGLISGIEDGAKRIKRIVHELREYSAKEGLVRLKPENVNKALEQAVSLLAHKIKKTTNTFTVDCGKNLPAVNGDLQKLEQVFVNLIQNALEALRDNSKGVFLKSYFDQEKEQVMVEIHDEGVGIPKKHIPQVMDPFYTTKRASGGTGLGLAVSSNIIRQHGGRIEVESEEGKGSTFRIALPAVQKPKRKRILLVDDDPKIRETLKEVLEGNPRYLVTEASNGTEACIVLGKDPPDLLILDAVMPGMNGVEVCQTIRREPSLSLTQVMVITGYMESPIVREIEDTGFHEIMAKPFRSTDFLARVDRILSGGEKVT